MARFNGFHARRIFKALKIRGVAVVRCAALRPRFAVGLGLDFATATAKAATLGSASSDAPSQARDDNSAETPATKTGSRLGFPEDLWRVALALTTTPNAPEIQTARRNAPQRQVLARPSVPVRVPRGAPARTLLRLHQSQSHATSSTKTFAQKRDCPFVKNLLALGARLLTRAPPSVNFEIVSQKRYKTS